MLWVVASVMVGEASYEGDRNLAKEIFRTGLTPPLEAAARGFQNRVTRGGLSYFAITPLPGQGRVDVMNRPAGRSVPA
jgi:hypothetical protein